MKNRKLLGWGIAGVLTAVFFFGSCKQDNLNPPKYTEFVMQIDSIQMPATLKLGQSLKIKFYGTIGNNGCYSFSRFAPKAEGNTITVTAYGKLEEKDVCAEVISRLEGGLLEVNLLDTGRYVVHVSNPNPPDIFDTVTVRMP